MKTRPFGATSLVVSELGLGCARIGGIFQQDPGGFVNLLAAAYERGINFFDTADMYSQGESETLLGRAFKGRRDRVIIASKVGYCLPTQRRLVAKIKPLVRPLIQLLKIKRAHLPGAVRGALAQDFSPAYIRTAVEASLRRLRTDYLDVLQLHSPSAEVVARGEWLDALESLKRAGKVRYYAISSDTVEAATAALRYGNVSALQVVVSLLEQSFARSVVPQAHAQKVAVIARECLSNGLLVKAEGDVDLNGYWPSPEVDAVKRRELSGYRQTAQERGIPLARLALDYATSVEGVSVALVGVRSLAQLDATLRDFGR